MGFITVVSLSIVSIFYVGNAEADWSYHRRPGRPYYWRQTALPPLAVSITVGEFPYYYHRGSFYRRGPRNYVIVPAPVGAVVTTLPKYQRVVVVGGVTYYNCDGVYYRSGPTGYIVVPSYEVAEAQTAATSSAPVNTPQAFVVNVLNKNGSYTPVTLQLASNGMYIGPQGEIYPNQPTAEQLKAMYGK